jgi:hypothetical protein
LGQIVGRVQNATVVDVRDVDHELIVLEFGLRCFDGDASLSSHAPNCDL